MASTKHTEDAILLMKQAARNVWPGCYRGRVEGIDDPDRLDKVRVRVWALHGDESIVPDTALPWAEVSEQSGGGYDFGSYNPPPIGSGVWVMFEGGQSDFPVITGTFRGAPVRDANNSNVFLTKSNKPEVETGWAPPDGESETPKDVFDDSAFSDPHPTRRVWEKSFKGHTIVVEEGDGKELLRIIDRAGQIIEMDCPVNPDYAKANGAQRGARNAMRGDQLPHDAMENKRACIRIRDLSGQELVLDARKMDERVLLKSRSRDGSGENYIELRSGKGKDSITIMDQAGDYIKMDPHSTTPITIKDSTGNSIVFDKETGKVIVTGSKISEENAAQKVVNINGTKTSNIKGDENKEILGNKKVNVVNDVVTGIMGNAQLSVGGAAKILMTNTSPNGPELVAAMDIQMIKGNLHYNAVVGNILLDTTAGMVELSTIAGTAKLLAATGNVTVGCTIAGNVEASTLLGNATLKTIAGVANIDGTSVKIGNVLASIFPLVRGTPLWGYLLFEAAACGATATPGANLAASLIKATTLSDIKTEFIAWSAAITAHAATSAALIAILLPLLQSPTRFTD